MKIFSCLQEEAKSCLCGGWIRVSQLEHDLSELRSTHELVLTGLHNQLDQLKQKNRGNTFYWLISFKNAKSLVLFLDFTINLNMSFFSQI